MDQFKKKFLDAKLNRHFGQKIEKAKSGINEAKLYYDWLRDENAKDELAKLNPVTKLSNEQIEEEVQVSLLSFHFFLFYRFSESNLNH